MSVKEHPSDDERISGGRVRPSCIGLTPDASPKVQMPLKAKNSQTGVSTRYALSSAGHLLSKRFKQERHWYTLRTTYGREKKAYDFLVSRNIEAFYPTLTTSKFVKGKQKIVQVSRLPNLFFAYGTEEELKRYVYDNVNLPFLRFYYRHFHDSTRVKEPLIVPTQQIESLRIICAQEKYDVMLVSDPVEKFKVGQRVRVIAGPFKGVIGRVARFKGQQRVGIIIGDFLTAITAYIASAFLDPLD